MSLIPTPKTYFKINNIIIRMINFIKVFGALIIIKIKTIAIITLNIVDEIIGLIIYLKKYSIKHTIFSHNKKLYQKT